MDKQRVLIEASVVGLACVFVGIVVSAIISPFFTSSSRNKPSSRYIPMGVALFVTGLVTHMGFEYLGTNKWYCKNGSACLSE